MPYVTTGDGTRLHYEERGGSGDVVVLVHGYTGALTDWDETVPRLPADWRVIRLDLRGAGGSDHAPDGYTIPQYARDLRDLARELNLPPFVLVGHSMGGAISAQYALDYPETLRGVLLLAPAPLNGLPPLPPEMIAETLAIRGDIEKMKARLRGWVSARPLSEAQLERMVRNDLAVSEGHLYGSLQAMIALRLYDRLPTLQPPVLYVAGDRDNLVPVRTVLEAFLRTPGAYLQVYTRVGHMVQVEVPDEFAALLADFVRAVARPAGAIA
jgi:3-oxoadipate enol-lactonase